MNLTALMQFESKPLYERENLQLDLRVTAALLEVVQIFFQRVSSSIVVTLACKREIYLLYYFGILQRLFILSDFHMQFVHVNVSDPKRVEGIRLHNVIAVDSLEAFLIADIAQYTSEYNTNEYYYIFLQQSDAQIPFSMQKIFEYCWENQLIDCTIQVQNADGGIRLYTYYPFTDQHCNRVVPVQIDEFRNGWQNAIFFPRKLANMHSCPLRVGVLSLPPYLIFSTMGNMRFVNGTMKGVHVGGTEGHLLLEYADLMNFTVQYILLEMDDRTRNACCGMAAALKSRSIHLGLGFNRLRPFMWNISSTIFPHAMSYVVSSLIINAHNLSSYQIFMYPFDEFSWLFIALTLLCTLMAANLIYYAFMHLWPGQRNPKRFVTVPIFISATLGVAVPHEPCGAPNRIIFLTNVWTTFLVRSLYTVFIFHIFRSNIHQTLPAKTKELKDWNYVSVMNQFTRNDLNRLPNMGGFSDIPQIVINSSNDLIALQYLEEHPHQHLVAVSDQDFVLYYVKRYHRPGMFHVMQQRVRNQHLAIQAQTHSFLIRAMNFAVLKVNSAGLLKYWREQMFESRYFNSRHLFEHNLIKMQDLVAIFVVMALMFGLSFLVFVLELSTPRIPLLCRIFGDRKHTNEAIQVDDSKIIN